MVSCSLGILGVAALGSAVAASPFSFDAAPGRLPKNVVPIDYSIALQPDTEARTLHGRESVVLNFRQSTATIQFNAVNLSLQQVQLDGKPVMSVAMDAEQQLVTVSLSQPAAVGRHVLSLSYDGKIDAGPPGLYAQSYVTSDGTQGFLISTKFEPTYARRMFPCWDEPAFRATFKLSATVPAGWATVGNMPVASRVVHGALATTTFARTPKMPSYLVEFTAGELSELSGKSRSTALGIWTARGQQQGGTQALANAQQILADYDDYFGFPFPLPKLDSIAVPGGFSGAMENWGAITYNDQLLLLTSSSTVDNRQTVYSVQAHEMAHQWNGDLVTMGWWDDLWLNESFASWRAAKQTDERNPTWNWWQAQDVSKETAMRADARASSHPIEQHVSNETQAQNAFDSEITYNKGQALLRMFEAYLGPDRFRDGIRRYMREHAFSNASSADLWNALSAVSGHAIGELAAQWTEQPGFPLVSVAASCDAQGLRTLRLSQRRYLLQPAQTETSHWDVPLQIRSAAGAAAQAVLLSRDGQTVAAGRCGESLSVNAEGVGFFRASYDAPTLQANTQHFAELSWGDRITLLDDQWALVESGLQPLPSYLALAEATGSEPNERAWDQIMEALDRIEYDERGTPGHDAFATYAGSIIRPLATRLGSDQQPGEAPGVSKLRRTLLRHLGIWGDQPTIAAARVRFERFVQDPGSLSPDDQPMVLSIIARNADAATFEQLHAIASRAKSETELRRDLMAMMDVADPQLAAQAARIALSDEIPPQAASLRLQLVWELNDQNPTLSWQSFSDNVAALVQSHQPYGPMLIAQYSPQVYWNSLPLDQLEAWIKSQVSNDMLPVLRRGMETARFQLAQKRALVDAADRYLARH
jgi:aminopeptidase N